MPVIGVKLAGRNYTWEQAFHEAVHNPLRDWPYTVDMLALAAGIESEEPERDAFSPSRLLGCHRQSVLSGMVDYYLDMDQSWPLVRGNMVHALMERARYPGVVATIREVRFYTTVDTAYGPQKFTAKPDLIVIDRIDTDWPSDEGHGQGNAQETIHIKVVDYKSKNGIKHDLTEAQYEHELQVNMYAYILSRELPTHLGMPEASLVVDELEIDYVDMARVRRFTSAGWLSDRGKRTSTRPLTYETLHLAPITIHPRDKVERFVRRRIEERIQAREQLPACSYAGTDKEYLCNYCPVRDACNRRTEASVS